MQSSSDRLPLQSSEPDTTSGGVLQPYIIVATVHGANDLELERRH